MTYYKNIQLQITDIDEATNLVQEIAAKQGFGIVSQFDVDKAFEQKLNLNFRPYRILGACNPSFAKKAIDADDKIGTIIPCNIMLQQKEDGIEIAIIDPRVIMRDINNVKLLQIADEISDKMDWIINQLKSTNNA